MGFSPVGCGGQGKDFPEEMAVGFGRGWWLEFCSGYNQTLKKRSLVGLLWWLSGKESVWQCRMHWLSP